MAEDNPYQLQLNKLQSSISEYEKQKAEAEKSSDPNQKRLVTSLNSQIDRYQKVADSVQSARDKHAARISAQNKRFEKFSENRTILSEKREEETRESRETKSLDSVTSSILMYVSKFRSYYGSGNQLRRASDNPLDAAAKNSSKVGNNLSKLITEVSGLTEAYTNLHKHPPSGEWTKFKKNKIGSYLNDIGASAEFEILEPIGGEIKFYNKDGEQKENFTEESSSYGIHNWKKGMTLNFSSGYQGSLSTEAIQAEARKVDPLDGFLWKKKKNIPSKILPINALREKTTSNALLIKDILKEKTDKGIEINNLRDLGKDVKNQLSTLVNSARRAHEDNYQLLTGKSVTFSAAKKSSKKAYENALRTYRIKIEEGFDDWLLGDYNKLLEALNFPTIEKF